MGAERQLISGGYDGKLDQTSLERLTEDSDLHSLYIETNKRLTCRDYFHDALVKAVTSEEGPREKKITIWFTEY